jgi:hypothetical protein
MAWLSTSTLAVKPLDIRNSNPVLLTVVSLKTKIS